jgi:hypothetical protein
MMARGTTQRSAGHRMSATKYPRSDMTLPQNSICSKAKLYPQFHSRRFVFSIVGFRVSCPTTTRASRKSPTARCNCGVQAQLDA